MQVLKRVGRSDITVHGFRSTFRDWCAESTNYPSDVAEMALTCTREFRQTQRVRFGFESSR